MTHKRYAAVLLFGPPGAGKGTHGGILAQVPGLFHLSSGEIFRTLNPSSDEAKEVFKYTSRGELAPDELTIQIWRRWLKGQIATNRFKPREDLLILDGIPRNVNQCELIGDHIEVMKLIHLGNSDEQTMINRITRRAMIEGRADDGDEEIIRRRFAIYRQETAPMLDFYPPEIVTEVDSQGTAIEVLDRIIHCIIPVHLKFLKSNKRSAGTRLVEGE